MDQLLRGPEPKATPIPFAEFAQSTVTFPLHTWQTDYLCPLLERFRTEQGLRIALHGPPQYGKSVITSQRLPAYLLGSDPLARVGLACYNETHATGFGSVVKDLLVSDDFASMFPDPRARIRKDAAAGRFRTDGREALHDAQYSFLAMGLLSGFTGKGVDHLIVDDPYKSAEEARSSAINEKTWRWWSETAGPRIPDTTNVAVMFHRYHEDDFAGRLLQTGKFEYVRFPAIADANSDGSDPTGRFPGELLSAMRSREWLESQQRDNPQTFLGQFQGTPRPDEGALFKAAWLSHVYKTLPRLRDVCAFWDLALKAGEHNDETACVVAGTGADDGQLYILRVRAGRWETPDVASFLVAQADWLKERFGAEYRGDYVEDKVSGTTLMQYVRRERPDLALIPISVEGDKVARAHGVSGLCEAGRVLLPDPTIFPAERAHVGLLVQQLLSFPGGKHDDMCDVFVYAILRFMGRLNQRKSRRGKGGGMV